MDITQDGPFTTGASSFRRLGGKLLPASFSGTRAEYLAARTSAWLGVCLMTSPVYDVWGVDADAFLNSVSVNRDFARLPSGASRHMIVCNERGQMLADGVAFRVDQGRYRTYWLAPVLEYLLSVSDLDVHGEYVTDEYFFQLDGPKSLEILQRASGAGLEGLRFGRNTTIAVDGHPLTVHRLGMSGALAYELHGPMRDAEVVLARLRSELEAAGGRMQGIDNYAIVNHTPAGYPNQFQHFMYPYTSSGEGLAAFYARTAALRMIPDGSAADDIENFYATPYDVGWGSVVSFDHEFTGREALERIAVAPPRRMVTLEWDADDVADVFASQFRGVDVEPYDPIEGTGVGRTETADGVYVRGDHVTVDGRAIGIATGRTTAFWERRMISLASIEPEYAIEGRPVVVQWGRPSSPRKEIRAVVAQFPYYDGEFRNERYDPALAAVRG